MNLRELPQIVKRAKKRLGRGYGSGRGKTAGRGTKGQKARENVRAGFEGGQLPITKRLPLWRGKGKNKPRSPKPLPLPVGKLSQLPKGTTVTLALLYQRGLVEKDVTKVKLLAEGKLEVPLTVALPCSEKARQVIEAAGGQVTAYE